MNRMLHWLEARFEVRRTVFVIRHPCAVVASKLQHGAWSDARAAARPGRALDLSALPPELRQRFRPLVDKVEDALAVAWCLDNYLPLLHFAGNPWVILPYERLVRRKAQEAERLAGALGVPLDDRVVAAFDRPSTSTKTRLEADSTAQLSKWSSSLSQAHVARILGFVEAEGLSHLYGPEVEPNYEALSRLQDRRWRWPG